MDINKYLQNIVTIFKNGLSINFNKSISKDFFNSLIFCSTFTILILGLPHDTFNGLAGWFFKTIYPQYLEMDLSHQFNYERLIWSQVKISLFISIPVFLLTVTWTTVFYKANRTTFFPDNAIHLFLFIYRWVLAIQFAAITLVPFLSIKIFDIGYQAMQTGKQINQLPFGIIKKEIICLIIILLSFLLNFLYQAKNLLDLIQAIPRKWLTDITQRFTLAAIIPIILGTIISSYFSNFMKTDNVLNDNIFSYNQCIYMMQNPNIPGHNAIKAALQEVGCKKYTTCLAMTDERLRTNCLVRLYSKSDNFNFLAHNEKRDVCRS